MASKSNEKLHIQKARVLRLLRRDNALTQEDLARELNISRETVVAVENCHSGAISAIPADIMSEWWKRCRDSASDDSRSEFSKLIVNLYPD